MISSYFSMIKDHTIRNWIKRLCYFNMFYEYVLYENNVLENQRSKSRYFFYLDSCTDKDARWNREVSLSRLCNWFLSCEKARILSYNGLHRYGHSYLFSGILPVSWLAFALKWSYQWKTRAQPYFDSCSFWNIWAIGQILMLLQYNFKNLCLITDHVNSTKDIALTESVPLCVIFAHISVEGYNLNKYIQGKNSPI